MKFFTLTKGNDHFVATLPNSDLEDSVNGGPGNDTIQGYIDVRGSAFDQTKAEIADNYDLLNGGLGDDLLLGGGGGDILSGGEGQDTIDGGTGFDIMSGGEGADVFRFALRYADPGVATIDTGTSQRNDWINDFTQGATSSYFPGLMVGGDKIDLRGWENADHPGAVFVGHDDAFADALQFGQLHVGFHFKIDDIGRELTVIDLERTLVALGQPEELHHGPAGQIDLLGFTELTANDFIF